ncbi:MAG: nucleoside hydrolase [Candidatus Hydrogenedentes bacterium]|nr:nucleoside hydrolase [Candidatus Hydrogenedentota bacterium]
MVHWALLFFVLGSVSAAAVAPVPVVLDTDLGDDIDDTWALAMLLGSPQIDVKLIVTASDDTPAKTRLVAKILEAMGRTDIPLATGVKNSDRPLNQAAWLGDYSLKNYKGKVIEDGIGALIDAIKSSPDRVTLCVIGPQTNIKAALERDKSIADNARVVLMAGSVYIGYEGKKTPDPEWNVFRDVAAARGVFAAPWEITMAPLDICGTLRLTGPRYAEVKDSKNARATATILNYDAWTNRKQHPNDSSSILFDTAASYLCFDETFMEMEMIKLSIDNKGSTVPDEKGRPVRCAVRWKDRDAFEDLLVRALTEDAAKAK